MVCVKLKPGSNNSALLPLFGTVKHLQQWLTPCAKNFFFHVLHLICKELPNASRKGKTWWLCLTALSSSMRNLKILQGNMFSNYKGCHAIRFAVCWGPLYMLYVLQVLLKEHLSSSSQWTPRTHWMPFPQTAQSCVAELNKCLLLGH